MRNDLQIRRVALPLAGLQQLRMDAAAQGFRFLERLVSEWEGGLTRFDKPGEHLAGAFAYQRLIAVGGISRDPYVAAVNVGRLRHFYVLHEHRRRGVGSALIDYLLQRAGGFFDEVRLRTDSETAANFYLLRKFLPVIDPNATHSRAI